jgi:hypothetical protein
MTIAMVAGHDIKACVECEEEWPCEVTRLRADLAAARAGNEEGRRPLELTVGHDGFWLNAEHGSKSASINLPPMETRGIVYEVLMAVAKDLRTPTKEP